MSGRALRQQAFNDAGRLIRVTLPDLDGNPFTTGDIAAYEYAYDARGNQTLIRDPLGRETRFAYDEQGRQLSRTLPRGFGPDGILGTPDDTDLPEGAFQETMEYDDRGRVQLAVSFEGVVTRYVYDQYGRLAAREFFDNLTQYGTGTPTETVSYTYDALGRRVETASAGRTVTSTYDAQGRLVSESGPEGTINYTYDDLGRLTSTIVGTLASPERITSYTYDALGRLKSVTEDRDPLSSLDSPLSTLYAYDLLGNLDQEIAANGVITDYTYDDLNRLDEMVSFVDDGTVNGVYDSGSDTLIAGFDYTVRDDGKRTAVTETFGSGLTNTISWTYDNLGRLTAEDFDSSDNSLDYIHTYTFDLAGNRLTWEKDTDHSGTVDETVTYTYDANDRLLEEDSTDGTTTTYGYSHTQQTSKTVVDSLSSPLSTLSFSYNLQGRMSSVLTETYSGGTLQSRQQVAYGYDDAGLRVSSQESVDSDLNGSPETLTTTTTYLFDSQNHTGYQQVLREVRVDEQTGESTVIDYTFGHDELVQTRRDFDDQGGLVSDVLLVFGHDGHGSVRVLTDLLGAIATVASVAQIFHFDAYGNAVGFNPAQAATSLLYSGEFFDSRIGQQYLRARWYDPNTGRFNRLDPFFGNLSDPLSFHKYLYAHADPRNGRDPTGLTTLAGQTASMGAQSNLRATNQGTQVGVVARAFPTFARAGAWALNGLKANVGKWVVNWFFPTSIGPIITLNSAGWTTFGAWAWASFSQFVVRAGFTTALGHFSRSIIRTNTPPIVDELRRLAPVAGRVLNTLAFLPGIPELPANRLILDFADKLEERADEAIYSSIAVKPYTWSQLGGAGTIATGIQLMVEAFGVLAHSNALITHSIKKAIEILPPRERADFHAKLGVAAVASIDIEPNYSSVLWDAYWGDLQPADEIRAMRAALLEIERGNFIGAKRDLAHAIRSLRKYGRITINGSVELSATFDF